MGNLFKYKNIQFLVKNFLQIKNEFPNIHLQIIGDGEYRESLVKFIDELYSFIAIFCMLVLTTNFLSYFI